MNSAVTVDAAHERLLDALQRVPDRVVACSGGVDSIVLASIAHDADPHRTTIGHTVTPAVPAEATARVIRYARDRGWNLELVESTEFEDESYLSNPVDRCYFCKDHLYDALDDVVSSLAGGATILSGANTDDLGEYRPGLTAAAEHGVVHPYLEAEIDKATVRALARSLELDVAEIPAAPCLASRLYTGTRVREDLLRAVEIGEATVRELTGVQVVRCRVRGDDVLIEVPEADRHKITDDVLADVGRVTAAASPKLNAPQLDSRPYRPGQAFTIGS